MSLGTIQEYTIRVPPETNKKYHVMRFSASNNVDFNKWKSVKLERDFNLKEYKSLNDDEIPKFGAGSEFGRESREEARRKRYSKYASKHKPEDHPWILNLKTKPTGSSSKSRKFKGLREGGVTDNTSYYVFFQAHDGAFEAFPVSEWYNFTPIPRYKPLTAEEAEEQYEKRDKILNFFTVMATKKKSEFTNDSFSMEEGIKTKKITDFKVSDIDDWGGMGSDGSGYDSDEKASTKKKPISKDKKKKESDDDGDSEPVEESDEGDFDTREVDYMSSSSSDSDIQDVEKLNKELKGVEDEFGLRKLVASEDEDDEEEENKDKNKILDENKNSQESDKTSDVNKSFDENKVKIKQEKKISNSSSSSDDSDFDENKFQSSIFMQKNVKTIKKEPEISNKRKLENESTTPTTSSNNKKPKLTSDSGITEETVKRYLMRKPITTTELLKNLKKMKLTKSGEELVSRIAQILKKLNPEKQVIQNKLYLYIKPE